MADITSPQVVAFVNQQVRPLAEEIRALKARIDACLTEWNAGINVAATNDASVLQDGRDGEGVSRLSGIDINNFMGLLQGIQTRLNQTGTAQVVAKPCVRPLEAR